MKRMFTSAVRLALVLALLAPAAASADAVSGALAQERYYSSYGEAAAVQPRTVTVEKAGGGAWKGVAVGAGALVLVLSAAQFVTLGRLRALRAT
jgi:hypothetical protein